MLELDPKIFGFTAKIFGEPDSSEVSFWTSRFSSFGAVAQKELPNRITAITPSEAARVLSIGYYRVEGKLPSAKVLGLLLAQWALETGNGKYIHGFNFGNVKRYSGSPYYQYFRCSEIINGVEVFFDPPAPECAFAAYLTAEDGAEAYVRILKKRAHWWTGLLTGDIKKFNSALSTAPKYYTANPATYLTGLQNRYDSYFKYAKEFSGSWLGTGLQYGLGIGIVGISAYYAKGRLYGKS